MPSTIQPQLTRLISFVAVTVLGVFCSSNRAAAYNYDDLVCLVSAEQKALGKSDSTGSLDQRLQAVEVAVLGKVGTGTEKRRLALICSRLGLQRANTATPAPATVRAQPEAPAPAPTPEPRLRELRTQGDTALRANEKMSKKERLKDRNQKARRVPNLQNTGTNSCLRREQAKDLSIRTIATKTSPSADSVSVLAGAQSGSTTTLSNIETGNGAEPSASVCIADAGAPPEPEPRTEQAADSSGNLAIDSNSDRSNDLSKAATHLQNPLSAPLSDSPETAGAIAEMQSTTKDNNSSAQNGSNLSTARSVSDELPFNPWLLVGSLIGVSTVIVAVTAMGTLSRRPAATDALRRTAVRSKGVNRQPSTTSTKHQGVVRKSLQQQSLVAKHSTDVLRRSPGQEEVEYSKSFGRDVSEQKVGAHTDRKTDAKPISDRSLLQDKLNQPDPYPMTARAAFEPVSSMSSSNYNAVSEQSQNRLGSLGSAYVVRPASVSTSNELSSSPAKTGSQTIAWHTDAASLAPPSGSTREREAHELVGEMTKDSPVISSSDAMSILQKLAERRNETIELFSRPAEPQQPQEHANNAKAFTAKLAEAIRPVGAVSEFRATESAGNSAPEPVMHTAADLTHLATCQETSQFPTDTNQVMSSDWTWHDKDDSGEPAPPLHFEAPVRKFSIPVVTEHFSKEDEHSVESDYGEVLKSALRKLQRSTANQQKLSVECSQRENQAKSNSLTAQVHSIPQMVGQRGNLSPAEWSSKNETSAQYNPALTPPIEEEPVAETHQRLTDRLDEILSPHSESSRFLARRGYLEPFNEGVNTLQYYFRGDAQSLRLDAIVTAADGSKRILILRESGNGSQRISSPNGEELVCLLSNGQVIEGNNRRA